MAVYEDYSQFVAFHSAISSETTNPANAINPNLAGAALAVGELARYGIGAVFVPETEYVWGSRPYACGFMTEPTGNPTYPLALQSEPHEVPLGKGGIQAVRSRIITPLEMQGSVPIVNDQAVRKIGSSKSQQAELFAGLMPATVLVRPNACITSEHLDQIKGDEVAISLDRGNGSQLALVGVKKRHAPEALEGLRKELCRAQGEKAVNAPFVVQEVANGVPWNGLGDPEANHEMRIMCFADNVDGTVRLRPHLTYRENAGAIRSGTDRWVPLPQDMETLVPYRRAATYIASTILMETGSQSAIIAVDLFRTEQDGPIRLRGVHTRDPIFADRMKGEGPAYRRLLIEHSHLMAHQLATLALGYAPDVR